MLTREVSVIVRLTTDPTRGGQHKLVPGKPLYDKFQFVS